MNDLEQRIRQQLSDEVQRFQHRDRVSLGVPRIGPSVRRRVRRRQLGMVVLSLAVAGALAAGSVVGVGLLRNRGVVAPASHGFPTGIQEAPPGWPVVDFGGREAPPVRGSKALIAFGSADSTDSPRVRWSLRAYRQPAPGTSSLCRLFTMTEPGGAGGTGGSCGLGPQLAYAASLHPRYVLLGSDVQSGVAMVAYEGELSPLVATVKVSSLGDEEFEPRILPGPEGFGANFFIFFAPSKATGQVLVYNADGAVLQQEPFCSPTGGSYSVSTSTSTSTGSGSDVVSGARTHWERKGSVSRGTASITAGTSTGTVSTSASGSRTTTITAGGTATGTASTGSGDVAPASGPGGVATGPGSCP